MTITLLTPGYVLAPPPTTGTLYAAFITVTGPVFVIATPVAGGFNVVVPMGLTGQNYAVITGCNSIVSDETVVAGPALIEITK